MRRQGSVTVVFSFVFVLMFGFIVSFFEMAAYTSRRAYHASAALLATENYFAAYLAPLYEHYHIFAREVPEGEDIVSWSEKGIAEDVSYMTVKQDGERSLLLRSGANYEVKDISVLTENKLEGFYAQAVNAMKYRAAPEVVNLLKEFSGMTEQADAHLEYAAAKAETDSAYAEVDNKIQYLIELIDGVELKKYEKYAEGKSVIFQKDAYVKYFCTTPGEAADYFDRAEVYQAFLGNFENPCGTLESLATRAEELAQEMENREYEEMLCRSELARIRGQIGVTSKEITQLKESREEVLAEYTALIIRLRELDATGKDKERMEALALRRKELETVLDDLKSGINQYENTEKELKKQEEQTEKVQKELEQKASEQQKRAKNLGKEEESFLKQCKIIADICDEAYGYTEEIRQELVKAKKVRENCGKVLNSVQSVIGEDAATEYGKELERYNFYEQAEGYDFDRMKQTLSENKSRLRSVSKKIEGTNRAALRKAAEELREEKKVVEKYSFEGLRLDYGEMSLEENPYEGVEDMLSEAVAKGFLGFLTKGEVSDKALEISYLPSGFRFKEEKADVFSLLGADMSGIFKELQTLLPEESSLGGVLEGAADSILFHSYLATHFSDYLEENAAGALSYEQEYLIAGEETDRENLSAVAMRICAIRTVLHFISLYTDGARKGTAEQAALAACGIIGLPALKSVITSLLLFVWALEEAIVDTAVLLQGKRILLYPGRNGGSIPFREIVQFSKSFVLEKAELKKDEKGVTAGYNEFLHLLLFLTPREDKKYRAADLIQENLRKIYKDSFRVERCVWKMSYETDDRSYEYAYK